MKKPAFWNSITIYLLLYNNSLLIIGLIMSLIKIIDGTSSIDTAVGYQVIVFLVYIAMIWGLLVGGITGYRSALLFVPFVLFEYFYPPLMMSFIPSPLVVVFRVIEFCAMMYLLLSPQSRAYINNQKDTRSN